MTPRERKPLDLNSYEGRFAARLALLRKKSKLSVEDVTANIGIPRTTLYNWESAISVPPLGMFPKLAEIYGVKVRSLLPEK